MQQRGEINDSHYDPSLFQIVLGKSERVAFVLQKDVDLIFILPSWEEVLYILSIYLSIYVSLSLSIYISQRVRAAQTCDFQFGQLFRGKLTDQFRGKKSKLSLACRFSPLVFTSEQALSSCLIRGNTI